MKTAGDNMLPCLTPFVTLIKYLAEQLDGRESSHKTYNTFYPISGISTYNTIYTSILCKYTSNDVHVLVPYMYMNTHISLWGVCVYANTDTESSLFIVTCRR